MKLIAIMVSTLACGPQATAEPCLVFSKSELPAIRDRIDKEQDAVVWQDILARANDYCTPGSHRYADPDKLDAPRETIPGLRGAVCGLHFNSGKFRRGSTSGRSRQQMESSGPAG